MIVDKRSDRARITALLRSNTALLLLSFIAIFIFIIFLRGPSSSKTNENNTPMVVPSVSPETVFAPSAPENSAYSPLKNMPAPSTFKSFVYKKGGTISVSLLCKDVYAVVLIFPATIDYRSDPLSAIYNTATPCIKNETYKEIISLDPLKLQQGAHYYDITASQGKKGAWYDPH